MTNIQKWLKCKLTDRELLDYGRRVAEKCGEAAKLEAEKKAAVASFAYKLKTIDGEVASLSDALRTGEEERPVECSEDVSQENNRYILRRLDTGEVLEDRKLTLSEKQKGLPFGETEAPPLEKDPDFNEVGENF